MDILRKGCQGRRVAQLQELLKNKGYPIQPDGVFGQQTYIAVCQFQEKNGLQQDGIVGRDTWNALSETPTQPKKNEVIAKEKVVVPTETSEPNKKKTVSFADMVKILNIEEAAIRAVCKVESGGRSGFFKDGRPMILFEGHIFWRELKKRGVDPTIYEATYSDVLYPKWDKSKYKGGIAEYERLEKATTINEDAALCSASWGMFQIMGFNFKLCNFDSVKEYVEAMKADSTNHMLSFIHFLKNTGIDKPLRTLNWAGFAEKYNGPGYKQNRYDEKLQQEYLRFKQQLSSSQ